MWLLLNVCAYPGQQLHKYIRSLGRMYAHVVALFRGCNQNNTTHALSKKVSVAKRAQFYLYKGQKPCTGRRTYIS